MQTNSHPAGASQQAMQPQRIVFPWNHARWKHIKSRLDSEIKSLVEVDSRIVSIHEGSCKSRMIIDAFNLYASDATISDKYDTPAILAVFDFTRRMVLEGPRIFRNVHVRVLGAGISSNVTLTRRQVVTLLSCAWFGLFDTYGYITRGRHRLNHFPKFSMIPLFQSGGVFALHCMLKYFAATAVYVGDETLTRITVTEPILRRQAVGETVAQVDDELAIARDLYRVSIVVIHRAVLAAAPAWTHCDAPIADVRIARTGEADELPVRAYTVPVGDTILTGFREGITTADIWLLLFPECMVAGLVCPALTHAESVTVVGAERFNGHTGIGAGCRYIPAVDLADYNIIGDFEASHAHATGRRHAQMPAPLCEAILPRTLVCIDPTTRVGTAQFTDDFDRDLNKAYIGYAAIDAHGEPVGAGHWSPKYYSGDPSVKFLQLLLASSAAGRPLVYRPFTADFAESVDIFVKWLQEDTITCGQLYNMYRKVVRKYTRAGRRISELDLFDTLMKLDPVQFTN